MERERVSREEKISEEKKMKEGKKCGNEKENWENEGSASEWNGVMERRWTGLAGGRRM